MSAAEEAAAARARPGGSWRERGMVRRLRRLRRAYAEWRLRVRARLFHGFNGDLTPRAWRHADEVHPVPHGEGEARSEHGVTDSDAFPFRPTRYRDPFPLHAAAYHDAALLVRDGVSIAYDRAGRILWPSVAPVAKGIPARLEESLLRAPRQDSRAVQLDSLCLLSGFRSYNYYHWTVDSLLQVPLYRALFPEDDGPPCGVACAERAYTRASLARAGLDPDRFLLLENGVYGVSRLVLLPNTRVSHWACSNMAVHRFRAGPGAHPSRRPVGPARLFVSRPVSSGAKRALRNDQELFEALAPLGFVRLDPGTRPFVDQVAMFSDAQMIVGAHGAGLTNVVYTRGPAAVVEIFRGNKVLPFYYNLSRQLGFRYEGVVAQDCHGGPEAPFAVSVDAVLAAVGRAGEGLNACGTEPATAA